MEEQLQHTAINGNNEYVSALDSLCGLAQRNLCLFEKDFEGMGYNNEARYLTLRALLLANPVHRLRVLCHEPRYLATRCPRMILLLQQFSNSLFIYQTPKNLQHLTEPFAIADEQHYVRRFHFDDPRGILARHDPTYARTLKSRFDEMWASSHAAISPTKLGL